MRNVVLITWDSVRADHYSCYGYRKKTTPFLDRLAEKGIKFENAIVSGVPTPVSMAGIFTCNYYNGVFDPRFLRRSTNKNIKISGKTLSLILSKNKINTAAFHSNPYVSRFFGFDVGFNSFNDFIWIDDGRFERSSSILRKYIIKILNELNIIDKARYYYNMINILIKNNKNTIYYPFTSYYSQILDWVDKVEFPYFIWILLTETHFPYLPSKWNRFEKLRAYRTYFKFYNLGSIDDGVNIKLNSNEYDFITSAYDDCIREADRWTEQLWKDLRDTDPIFIVHADHGEAFGEHGFFGHPPEHYEYLIRVPLVIYNADVKGVVKEPVSLLRLAPTICELAGVKNAKNELPQPSLLEEAEYTPPIVENKLESGYRVTVRDVDWKLIVNPDRGDELYNIRKDPMEQNNLINDERDIVKELRALAEKHLKTRIIRGRIGDSVRALKRLKKI